MLNAMHIFKQKPLYLYFFLVLKPLFDAQNISCFLNPMKQLLATLLIQLPFACFALSYSGVITSVSPRVQVRDSASRTVYTLTGTTPLMAMYLNRLKSNDFMSFDATKNSPANVLSVNSINYVGLSDLLGAWESQTDYCFNFASYTEFYISKKAEKKCTSSKKEDPPYTYLINPDSKDWTILVSNVDNNTYIANLVFLSESEVQLQLYDSETGDILKTLTLTK